MGLGLFENYSQTIENARQEYRRPLKVNFPPKYVFNKVSAFLKENKFQEIKTNEKFFDLWAKVNGFEYSFQISSESMFDTYINISVYGEHKRGLTRGKLKKISILVSEYIKD